MVDLRIYMSSLAHMRLTVKVTYSSCPTNTISMHINRSTKHLHSNQRKFSTELISFLSAYRSFQSFIFTSLPCPQGKFIRRPSRQPLISLDQNINTHLYTFICYALGKNYSALSISIYTKLDMYKKSQKI